MIIFKATVEMRDDTEKKYTCVEYPFQSNEYWVFKTSPTEQKYIPKEAVKSVNVKDLWKK